MNGDARRQGGFALVETGLVMALLLSLLASVALLGEWHGHGLRAAHASRLLAFLAARGEESGVRSAIPGGGAVARASTGFSMPGGAATAALRRDWGMAGDGLLIVEASARAARHASGTSAAASAGLLRRHTALIGGAGHAAGDRETQARIADNRVAWRRVADRTRRAGRRVALALGRIDAGWGRAAPDFDWLSRWADLLPAERLGVRRKAPAGLGVLRASGRAR
ncbi:hypothetical protein [Achromobacter aloeverae]|uniref:hypothetical protein n=1 Tax=Achromobacter aloeverae TaxID=1750518 RepID=UPI00100E3E0D|nr:hypothetical protein [Achromobacter aloeverae]